MARTYLYLSIDTPTDDKLIGRSVLERYLWVCLLCLAKRAQTDTGDPTIRGHNASILAARFNLGSAKQVQAGLDYFAAAKPAPMIDINTEGSIIIKKFIDWQGEYDPAVDRERARDRQRKSREKKNAKSHTSHGDN
jgi:hypothetical protein